MKAARPSTRLAPRRRALGWLLAAPAALGTAAAWAQAAPDTGLRDEVGRPSRLAGLVPAEQVEAAAAEQYVQLLRQAAATRQLLPPGHPQVQRLRAIARRLVPYAPLWNARAAQWRWEVNLLAGRDLNAFCMPGGKIAFYFGLLQQLQLDDDEVAAVMGHEIAHALREHARERIGKTTVTRGLIELGSAFFGLGGTGRVLADVGGQLLTLRFSRDDESEADIVGLDLMARAGYDPGAGLTLWRKMLAADRGAPPPWMSTHPAGATRLRDIEARLPKVLPLYRAAPRPPQRFAPPAPA
ncbi:MAG: M48 family metallopeptidase [Burkholderiales bacterium]|nr:M48 family metallopeptidase [Burkholderiales bacterium]MDE2276867.1 M48 family metallopeptidase [Burkholderiales bacterium]